MDILLVGIGGIFGSITRFVLGKLISKNRRSVFPLGPFIINISGAMMLGVVTSLSLSSSSLLIIADGFLGAYTTFSTFMYESVLLRKGNKSDGLLYIISSILLGLIGFFIGKLIINIIFK